MLSWKVLAKEIADEIWKRDQRVDLTSAIEEILQKKGISISNHHTLEHFDRLKRFVSKHIQHKIEDCIDKGITPKYAFSEVDQDILVLKIDKSSNKVRKEIVSTIQRLSWRGFEHFCVHLLRNTGVKKCNSMRGTKEEGIDLFGLLDLGQVTGFSVWYKVYVRVLGQAKKSRVAEPAVRLLNQDIESFSREKGRAFQLAPQWFKTVRMPLIGFMLTSDRFTKDASKWAEQHNIVVRDVHQMVEDLLKGGGQIPGLYHTDGKITFQDKVFLNYFESLGTESG